MKDKYGQVTRDKGQEGGCRRELNLDMEGENKGY